MLTRQLVAVAKGVCRSSTHASRRAFSADASPDLLTFPNEYEGNIYDHNWSLCEDGVIPVGNAYVNARVDLLKIKSGVKKGSSGAIAAEAPLYTGKYTLKEAGATISQDDFSALFTQNKAELSSGVDIFVEDAALGSYSKSRVGVRVVTQDPKMALIARTLLLQPPPFGVDHRARFDGWNKDPRWDGPTSVWNGEKFNVSTLAQGPTLKGQRPIAAFIGGAGSDAVVQYVENSDGAIIGANVVIGAAAPVEAVIAAIGAACDVVVNALHADVLALPSLSFLSKKGDSVVVVHADQAVVDAVADKLVLHGAYNNTLSTAGVSAMWSGVVASSASTKYAATPSVAGLAATPVPCVAVASRAALPVQPDNLLGRATKIAFYEKGGAKGPLAAEKAMEKIIAAIGGDASDMKKAAIAEIIKGVEFSVVSSASDVTNL